MKLGAGSIPIRAVLVWLLPLLCLAQVVTAAEVIPPSPKNYFNDYAGVVSAETATSLDSRLKVFEETTSNQVVVVVFPEMESDSSIEDYTVRVAQAWGVGQRDNDNGVVLFVFIAERKMFIQVGYGLEGALPDALCKQIIDDQIVPAFRSKDYDGGLRAGVQAIMDATVGQYTAAVKPRPNNAPFVMTFGLFLFLLFLLMLFRLRTPRSRLYTSGGPWWHSGGWGGRSGGGGGWSGGGGGGFSGGGGSFGGGGAGGGW